ncbi:MAG: hypothetical protein ACYS5F_15845 [Planctomycetota bacterium]|jgi:hypothetical protein
MAQQGLLDRWVEKLSSDSQSRDEAIKELVTLLNEDLRDELILAMELEVEADHLIYEHLAKEIRGIAKKKRELVKTIEKLITDLGGKGNFRDGNGIRRSIHRTSEFSRRCGPSRSGGSFD